MSRKTKLVLAPLVICLVFGVGLAGLAQENQETIEEVRIDEEVAPEDLEIKEPKILPSSRLYFLKEWGRGFQLFFAFAPLRKMELEQKFANERLMELKTLVEKGENQEILKKATEKYEGALEKIKARAEKIEKIAKEDENVNKFLDKFTEHQLLHQKILQKLEEQVPEGVFQKIQQARERHLERFGEVMTNLEDRIEKIREKIEQKMEEMEGSKFKDFKNLELLKKLEEKVPEQAKEAIQKAQENTLKRLRENLEKMTTPDQEKLQEYIENISGDKEKILEILEDLKSEMREKTETERTQIKEKIQEKIDEAKEKIIEKVQEIQKKTCPEIEKPALGFCGKGRIVIKKDEQGCIIEFKCVIPAELEIPSTPILPTLPKQPIACITLWDPVCGKDGKTYSNNCFAKSAGVEVTYQGECREKECQTDADCPQPLCAPLGTAMPLCIGVKAKCVENKCQIVEE